MKKITKKALKEILRKHKLWVNHDPNGERADLSGVDLMDTDLRKAMLDGADLSRASLVGADLSRASLYKADLTGANLTGAILIDADISGAKLDGVRLKRACLDGAYFYRGDGLDNTVCAPPLVCPEKGSFIGFKSARDPATSERLIVELLIPEDARRSSSLSRKCRCDKAVVVSITKRDGSPIDPDTYAVSRWDRNFIYCVGKTVSVNNFCENRWRECAPGIHFFITRQEAVEY